MATIIIVIAAAAAIGKTILKYLVFLADLTFSSALLNGSSYNYYCEVLSLIYNENNRTCCIRNMIYVYV